MLADLNFLRRGFLNGQLRALKAFQLAGTRLADAVGFDDGFHVRGMARIDGRDEAMLAAVAFDWFESSRLRGIGLFRVCRLRERIGHETRWLLIRFAGILLGRFRCVLIDDASGLPLVGCTRVGRVPVIDQCRPISAGRLIDGGQLLRFGRPFWREVSRRIVLHHVLTQRIALRRATQCIVAGRRQVAGSGVRNRRVGDCLCGGEAGGVRVAVRLQPEGIGRLGTRFRGGRSLSCIRLS